MIFQFRVGIICYVSKSSFWDLDWESIVNFEVSNYFLISGIINNMLLVIQINYKDDVWFNTNI